MHSGKYFLYLDGTTNSKKKLRIISICSICKSQVFVVACPWNTQKSHGIFVKIWSKVADVYPSRKKAAMYDQS